VRQGGSSAVPNARRRADDPSHRGLGARLGADFTPRGAFRRLRTNLNRELLDDILDYMSQRSMRSKLLAASSARQRPSPELLRKLRAGKAMLRQQRIGLPLQEKVRQLLQLQHIHIALLAKQRPLRPWERPWDVEP
jgi:hypothetical protein